MRKSEVAEVVATLMAAFPNARLPDASVAAYEHFLEPFERVRMLRAIERLVHTTKFLPAIAEIVATYEELSPPRPREMREWIPDKSPGDYRAIPVGDVMAKALPERNKS